MWRAQLFLLPPHPCPQAPLSPPHKVGPLLPVPPQAATPTSGWEPCLPVALPAGSLLSLLQISHHQPRLFFPRCLFGKEFSLGTSHTHPGSAARFSRERPHQVATCHPWAEGGNSSRGHWGSRMALRVSRLRGQVPPTWPLDEYLWRTCSVPGTVLVPDGPALLGLSVQASVQSQELSLMEQAAGCSSQGCPGHSWALLPQFPPVEEGSSASQSHGDKVPCPQSSASVCPACVSALTILSFRSGLLSGAPREALNTADPP